MPSLEQRLARRRANRRRSRRYFRLDLSAFANAAVGVVFTLLVIFMMVSGQPHQGLIVNEPLARHLTRMPAALREDAMKVVILRDGHIFFGNSLVASSDLPGQIRDRIRDGAEHKVYLVVDGRTRYTDVASVLDEVRHAGIRDVAFLAESPEIYK